jgi:hypothetical protein
MDKKIWILIILGVVIVVLVGFLLWPKTKQPVATVNPPATSDIEVTTPKAGDWISSPQEISGIVNGNGWVGFEGQVGSVKLLDSSGNELANGVLTATTDWTKLPTSFDTTLKFNPGTSETGELDFKNENPSGDPAKDKTFTLPVKFALGK